MTSAPAVSALNGGETPPPQSILVQKFGGSSVATAEGRLQMAAKVKRAIAEGCAPVVVVSAMGRLGDPYATDTLLSLVAGFPADAREQDLLMSCGETISIVVLAHFLRQHGVPATALTGADAGVITTAAHGEALIRTVDTARLLASLSHGEVPVVAGFQGVTPQGETTTLGRGGSDTTAVALGVALQARAVEIYSDVAGVMTADPRIYEGARLVPHMTYEELGELAVEGARVMHPRSVDLAGAYQLPMEIRSTFTSHPGTHVCLEAPGDALEKRRVVTSITPLFPVSQVVVRISHEETRCRLFETLAAAGLSLDQINICQEDLYFIVKQKDAKDVSAILEGFSVPFTVREHCAKISLVGVGMRGTPGVVGRTQRALYRAGISILHSTDSNITVSCLVAQADVPRAVEALHQEFLGI